MYTTVLFDFDHTLFDTAGAELAAYDHALTAVDVGDARRYFNQYKSINDAMWRRVEEGSMQPTDVRVERFVELIPALRRDGYDPDPTVMADAFVWGMGNLGSMLDGAESALRAARRGRALALITNGLSEVQRQRLELVGIAALFDAIVISSEVGAAKPSGEIFDIAFEQLGSPPRDSAIIVGDSLTSDIAGGHQYGIATCWYNPHHSTPTAEQRRWITYEIDDLGDLAGVL